MHLPIAMALDPLSLFILVLSMALIARTLVFVAYSAAHYVYGDAKPFRSLTHTPLVSILVPCYNEELTLSNCVTSLLNQTYPHFEIILINDGSRDATEAVCESWKKAYPGKIRTFTKSNGGKASALNYAIAVADGELIVTVDADSVFLPNTLGHLVSSFDSPKVGAVAGNVKVANRATLLGKLQASEYIIGINMYRRAFAMMGCVPVISGAIGAFRKEALRAVGGYSSDTLVEDMDLTIALAEHEYRVVYNEWAIAYTEAPEDMSQLYKQRFRWTLGGFQALKKYRHMLFNPKYGSMGMVSLPYFALSPFLIVGLSTLFIVSAISLLFTDGFLPFLSFYLAYVGTQAVLLFFAFAIDTEDTKLIPLSFIDILWHNFLMTFITVRTWFAHLTNEKAGWNPLTRLGKNVALA